MSEVTRILEAVEKGDRQAAREILPLVYDELRKLAVGHIANESPGQTLDATALVHEAYLRLVGPGEQPFANRAHFFAAAAEAMRRILVDAARRKRALKRGGATAQARMDPDLLPALPLNADRWIDLDDALARFEALDAPAAALAKFRVFGGLSTEEAGQLLGLSRANAFRSWSYASAWLSAALAENSTTS